MERLERELAGTPQAQERLSEQLEETRATVAELRATREKVEALEVEFDKERGAGDERRRLESELRDTRARVEQLEAALGRDRRARRATRLICGRTSRTCANASRRSHASWRAAPTAA